MASPNGPLPILFKLCPGGQKWPGPRCHQGHGQLSTDTTQVSDLGPHGPLVVDIVDPFEAQDFVGADQAKRV